MNAENFAGWLRKNGHTVIQTQSSYWYDAGPRVMQAFPYHWLIEPEEDELNDLLQKHNLLALRYSCPLRSSKGMISYHAIYEEPDYTLELLDRRSRQNVNKGLNHCTVEPIPFQRLADEGWQLENDTLDRQAREGRHDEKSWKNLCLAAAEIPGFEAWGALVNGKLAASMLTFQQSDCCEMLYQQCQREYMNDRVNNALTFVVSQTMMRRSTIKSIFYTLHSLDASPNVDEYKFRMNFKPKPVRQRVVFHPLFVLFANKNLYNIVAGLYKRNPKSHALAKTKGMLNFYLQGKLPLDQQIWPVPLEEERETILKSLHADRSIESSKKNLSLSIDNNFRHE
ncbi:MAG: hypothetical protein LLG42_07630 [Chloroflexi bacterium]|nr:hypothetical protein [Chloroflexota bacterium]